MINVCKQLKCAHLSSRRDEFAQFLPFQIVVGEIAKKLPEVASRYTVDVEVVLHQVATRARQGQRRRQRGICR